MDIEGASRFDADARGSILLSPNAPRLWTAPSVDSLCKRSAPPSGMVLLAPGGHILQQMTSEFSLPAGQKKGGGWGRRVRQNERGDSRPNDPTSLIRPKHTVQNVWPVCTTRHGIDGAYMCCAKEEGGVVLVAEEVQHAAHAWRVGKGDSKMRWCTVVATDDEFLAYLRRPEPCHEPEPPARLPQRRSVLER